MSVTDTQRTTNDQQLELCTWSTKVANVMVKTSKCLGAAGSKLPVLNILSGHPAAQAGTTTYPTTAPGGRKKDPFISKYIRKWLQGHALAAAHSHQLQLPRHAQRSAQHVGHIQHARYPFTRPWSKHM